ncbi:MAG: alpha/beta fold hydrolase [Candidatus Falkowbacteria bacterium]
MEKIYIKNRKGQKIAVIIEKCQSSRGLVFITHGLGDSKDSPHIKTFAKCFRDNNFSLIRFDTTNSFGESDGRFEEASITNYYEDLEDVIAWAKDQSFYHEPFVLCGHSLGATCSALFAEKYPEKVKALAPISCVVSGTLSKEQYTKEELEDWQKSGWLVETWPNGEVRLPWSYMEDEMKYNILTDINKLTMSTILIVGEFDHCTSPRHQQILFDDLPGQKGIYLIKGAPHTFRSPEHLNETYSILDKWLKTF